MSATYVTQTNASHGNFVKIVTKIVCFDLVISSRIAKRPYWQPTSYLSTLSIITQPMFVIRLSLHLHNTMFAYSAELMISVC